MSYPGYVKREIEIPGVSIVDAFRRSCARHADKVALVSMGVNMSYRELQGHADSVTAWLRRAGIGKGARVALMLPNVLAYAPCFFGTLQGGCIVANIFPLYTSREIHHLLKEAAPSVVIVLESFAEVLQKAMDGIGIDKVVIVSLGDLLGWRRPLVNFLGRHVKKMVPAWEIPGSIPFSKVLDEAPAAGAPAVPLDLEDVALLQFTGGTTGLSKAAALTHRNLVAQEAILEAWFRPVFNSVLATDSVILVAMPLCNVSGLSLGLIPGVVSGARCLLVANPRDIDGLIKTMAAHRIGAMIGINPFYAALANHPRIREVDFRFLFLSAAGGAATQEKVATKWHKLTGRPICDAFAMSEAAGILTCNPADLPSFKGTVGVPVPCTSLSIRDDEGREVPPGVQGEICVKGPQVMSGYWNQAAETATAMTPDGYLKTGDVGILDDFGVLRIVDRKKDMILVAGVNVFPGEIEEVIASLPEVVDVAVVGIEDDATGEAVCALVVSSDTLLKEEAIRAHCRTQLSPGKQPARIEFRDALPKNPAGKVLRRMLRDEMRQRALQPAADAG